MKFPMKTSQVDLMGEEINDTSHMALEMRVRGFSEMPPYFVIVESEDDAHFYSKVFDLNYANFWYSHGRDGVVKTTKLLHNKYGWNSISFGIIDWDKTLASPKFWDTPVENLGIPIYVTDGRDLESTVTFIGKKDGVLETVLGQLIDEESRIDTNADRLSRQIEDACSYIGAIQLVAGLKGLGPGFMEIIPRDLDIRRIRVSHWLNGGEPPDNRLWLDRSKLIKQLEKINPKVASTEFLATVDDYRSRPRLGLEHLCRGHDLVRLVQLATCFVGKRELSDAEVWSRLEEVVLSNRKYFLKNTRLAESVKKKLSKLEFAD